MRAPARRAGHAAAVVLTFVVITGCALASAGDPPLILGIDDDGPGFLLRPVQAEVGPDGNVYVLDAGDGFLTVFDLDGAFLRRLSGEGEGPGLFQRVDGAAFGFRGDDELYFTEWFGGHGWITVLSLDGTLIEVITPDIPAFHGLAAAAPLPDGGFLLEVALSGRTEPHRGSYLTHQPRLLVRMDAAGVLGPELIRTEHARLISTSPNGGDSSLPFTPSFAWAPQPDGRVVWSDGLTSDLTLLDPAGGSRIRMAADLPQPRAVTEAELDRWRREREAFLRERNPAWWQRFGRAILDYREARTLRPVVWDLQATEAGNLLVSGPADPEDGGTAYRLLDSRGRLLRKAVLPVSRLRLGATHATWFRPGDDGLPQVVVMARPADDSETFVRITDSVRTTP